MVLTEDQNSSITKIEKTFAHFNDTIAKTGDAVSSLRSTSFQEQADREHQALRHRHNGASARRVCLERPGRTLGHFGEYVS